MAISKELRAKFEEDEMYGFSKEPPLPLNSTLSGCMGYDTMDPNPTVFHSNHYADIYDVMNRKPYKAIYPQSFTYIPDYFLRNNITPFHTPHEDEDMAQGAITIAGMIEVYANGMPLIIRHEEDIEEILSYCRSYHTQLAAAANYGPMTNQGKQYLDKLQNFINKLERSADRLVAREDIKRTTVATNILDLFRRMVPRR